MYNNKKRVVILAALMVLLFAGQVMAQTTVLGFQLGKSTYDEVKAKLPKEAKITHDALSPHSSEYYGAAIMTDGTGYGVDGLKVVEFDFDKKRKLVEVGMSLGKRRFNDIQKILASKYQPVYSNLLFFKANRDYVSLSPPRDAVQDMPGTNSFYVHYKTGVVYRREELEERETAERKKAQERENHKALEREAVVERGKF